MVASLNCPPGVHGLDSLLEYYIVFHLRHISSMLVVVLLFYFEQATVVYVLALSPADQKVVC